MEDSFLKLAVNCASVICCRSTPKQKALVCVIFMLLIYIHIKFSYTLVNLEFTRIK